MQLKIAVYSIFVTCLVCPLRGKPLPGKGCYECQEEVWEEILCGSVPKNTSTVAPSVTSKAATAALPALPTTKQYAPATTPLPATRTSTTTSPEITTPTDPYKKCYCECKLGCKEFCRKVVQNPSEKQIIQVSKITEPVARGRIKSTHILQRELIPTTYAEKPKNSDKDNDNDSANDDYKPPDVDEDEVDEYTMPQPYASPIEDNCEDESEDEPASYHIPHYKITNVPSKTYMDKPVVPLIEPVYGPYAITEASINKNMHKFEPYVAGLQQPAYSYYSPARASADYDFPIPFENVFSKTTKTVHAPTQDLQIVIDGAMGKLAKPGVTTYATPPAPAIKFPLESRAFLDHYDDSFDSLVRNVIRSGPSYQAPY